MAARSAGEGLRLTIWTDRDLDCKIEFPVGPRTPVHALKRLLAVGAEADPGEFGIRTPCGRVLSDGDAVPEGLTELEVCDPRRRSESAASKIADGAEADTRELGTRTPRGRRLSDGDAVPESLPELEVRSAGGSCAGPAAGALQRRRASESSVSTSDWQSGLGDPSPSSSSSSGDPSGGPDCDSGTEYSFAEDGLSDEQKTGRTPQFDECDRGEEDSVPIHHRRSPSQKLTMDLVDAEEAAASPTDFDGSDEVAAPKRSLRGPDVLQLVTPSGAFGSFVVPSGCTLALWKRRLGSGDALGDRIVYPDRLRYYRAVGGTARLDPLGDAEPLPRVPDALAVFGPASLLRMLEMALVKKVGPPDPSRRARMPAVEEPAALPCRDGGRTAALEFHYLSCRGHRLLQEDRACAATDVPGCAGWASLFGVFDGHGGPQAADFVARRLPRAVGERLLEDRGDPGGALTRAFAAVDEELRAASGARGLYDLIGTTATVVLVVGAPRGRRRLYCASAGDSRAVLCRGGEAVDLSRDHKPELPGESERIGAAGGLVGNRGRIVLRRGSEGGLNLSRSLGDFSYKARRHLAADRQMVIPHPEVVELPVQEDDEFIAIGSDGLFSSCHSEELVASIRGALSHGLPLDLAVEGPVQEALPGGDNTTLCLVRLGRWG